MKRTTLRNTFAALSVAAVLGSTALQAAELDNREIGHVAGAQTENVDVFGLATGLRNNQVGHFAARVSDSGTGFALYGDTEQSLR